MRERISDNGVEVPLLCIDFWLFVLYKNTDLGDAGTVFILEILLTEVARICVDCEDTFVKSKIEESTPELARLCGLEMVLADGGRVIFLIIIPFEIVQLLVPMNQNFR